MVNKRDVIIAILAAFCLTSALLVVVPTKSQPSTTGVGEYDPWADTNDDGIIDIFDIAKVASIFGSTGQSVNKTELLYQVNATYASLLDKINILNATLHQLELGVGILCWNASYLSFASTSETQKWTDIGYDENHTLSLTINVNKTMYLMVMFSCMAENIINEFESGQIFVQALVDEQTLSPSWLYLNPIVEPTGFNLLMTHPHRSGYGTYGYNFSPQEVTPGNHTVKMQWRVDNGTAYLNYGTLTAIALPVEQ
jgi:hypothetical protein